MTSQQWFFWNCRFYSIVRNNVSEKSSHAKYWLFSALNSLKFKLLHAKLSYLVLVPEVRNRPWIREVSMGLCKTSNFSITLAIWNFAHILTAAVNITWWGLKIRMEKFAKWWCRPLELYMKWTTTTTTTTTTNYLTFKWQWQLMADSPPQVYSN